MEPITYDQTLLDLSKKVYVITGWDSGYMYFWGDMPTAHGVQHGTLENTPLLTLEFVLEKLPNTIELKKRDSGDYSALIPALLGGLTLAETPLKALLEMTLVLAEDRQIVK